MRTMAATLVFTFSSLTIGCEAILQPSQQGEWSDFHNPKHKISKDVREPGENEKPPAEK